VGVLDETACSYSKPSAEGTYWPSTTAVYAGVSGKGSGNDVKNQGWSSAVVADGSVDGGNVDGECE